ncbi:hypothetical protein Q4489_04330 [Thalassotalea sp. 1_MG-2023]|uniref:hypothetical protein n=1 Tax=Thalassotalea sp. 1_MG-2023 TaxID=3062680 RepID=UPI0026E3DD9E|nr:hypothetical protein [Thalassotalea sp. 1_MG-2023]MDO6426224.1 hypothetical protein [Thalassotalea sp. 1_MG-2023]
MQQVFHVGCWSVKPIVATLRKHKKYGDDFAGSVVLSVQDDTAHFSALTLKTGTFTKKDFIDFVHIARAFGCTKALYERLNSDGEMVKKEVML